MFSTSTSTSTSASSSSMAIVACLLLCDLGVVPVRGAIWDDVYNFVSNIDGTADDVWYKCNDIINRVTDIQGTANYLYSKANEIKTGTDTLISGVADITDIFADGLNNFPTELQSLLTKTNVNIRTETVLYQLPAAISCTQGNSVAVINLADHMRFDLSVTIHAWAGAPGTWSDIFHVGNTDELRLPGVYIRPESGTGAGFLVQMSNTESWSVGPDEVGGALTLGTQYNLVIEMTQTSLVIHVDGVEWYRNDAFAAHALEVNQNVYLTSPWYPAALATIHNLAITAISYSTNTDALAPTPLCVYDALKPPDAPQLPAWLVNELQTRMPDGVLDFLCASVPDMTFANDLFTAIGAQLPSASRTSVRRLDRRRNRRRLQDGGGAEAACVTANTMCAAATPAALDFPFTATTATDLQRYNDDRLHYVLVEKSLELVISVVEWLEELCDKPKGSIAGNIGGIAAAILLVVRVVLQAPHNSFLFVSDFAGVYDGFAGGPTAEALDHDRYRVIQNQHVLKATMEAVVAACVPTSAATAVHSARMQRGPRRLTQAQVPTPVEHEHEHEHEHAYEQSAMAGALLSFALGALTVAALVAVCLLLKRCCAVKKTQNQNRNWRVTDVEFTSAGTKATDI